VLEKKSVLLLTGNFLISYDELNLSWFFLFVFSVDLSIAVGWQTKCLTKFAYAVVRIKIPKFLCFSDNVITTEVPKQRKNLSSNSSNPFYDGSPTTPHHLKARSY